MSGEREAVEARARERVLIPFVGDYSVEELVGYIDGLRKRAEAAEAAEAEVVKLREALTNTLQFIDNAMRDRKAENILYRLVDARQAIESALNPGAAKEGL